MTENSDFDEDASRDNEVESTSLRMDEKNEGTDTSTNPRVSKSKKSKATFNYGIVATILILGSLLFGILSDSDVAVTPCVIGVTILGMTFYSWKRRRDCSDKGIIFYSHSQILYFWPIWLGAFVISVIISFEISGRKLVGESFGELA